MTLKEILESVGKRKVFNRESGVITFDDLIETLKARFNDLTLPEYHVPVKELAIWNDKRYFPPIIKP
jgi:hypothetical protein